MRILILNRFFWPDHAATSQLATDLAEHLAAAGNTVTVLCSRQRYDDPKADLPRAECHGRIEVRRLWTTRLGRHWLPGRALDYLSFYVACFWALCRLARPGVVVLAKTDPPLLSVVAAVACALRGGRLVTWQQDLFPEVAAALGLRWAAGPVGRPLRAARNWSLRRAALDIALNDRMAEHLVAEGVPADRVRVIANWSDAAIEPVPAAVNPLRRQWGLTGRRVIGYSGNLGRAHMASAVAELVRRTHDLPDTTWLFVGGGPGLAAIETTARELGDDAVVLRPYQPRRSLAQSLSVPDLHLVSLDPACEGLIMPSKFYGILAAGRALVVLGDPDGAIAREVRRHDLGICLDPARPDGWRDGLARLLADPGEIAAMGQRARHHYEAHYRTEALLRAWSDALAAVADASTGRPALAVRPT